MTLPGTVAREPGSAGNSFVSAQSLHVRSATLRPSRIGVHRLMRYLHLRATQIIAEGRVSRSDSQK